VTIVLAYATGVAIVVLIGVLIIMLLGGVPVDPID
jgi:hypothetical protein